MRTMKLLREEGVFNGYDNSELFWQSWLCENPKASLIVTHGHGEHSECYSRLAESLVADGYQVYGWDLRGHGRSTGKRGVVSSFDEYIRDLKLFVEFVRPRLGDQPFFKLGHSMGGLVLLKYLMRNGLNWSRGVILSSPLLGITVEVPALKKKLANFLRVAAPNFTLSSGIIHENLTSDRAVLKIYDTDHYRHDRISTVLYMGMLDNIEYVKARADKVPGPLLMQISGRDNVVSQAASEAFFKTLPIQDKQLIVYPGMLHEIYNEVGREKPIADLKRWLGQQLDKKK